MRLFSRNKSAERPEICVWHDDVRRPPNDEWVWAKTNDEAIELLETNTVTHISMDHDMGNPDPTTIPARDYETALLGGSGDGDGTDLVAHMIRFDLIPDDCRVHSANSAGAARMLAMLKAAGASDAYWIPFSLNEYDESRH